MVKSCIYILLISLLPYQSYAQAKKGYSPSSTGTRNYASGIKSFEYGIIGSNQDATGSPVGLVASIVRKVPSANKISDKYGNANISLRGRNSLQAGDEVLWDIDGVRYFTPPMIGINQVKYVEIVKGLAASNSYGSEGAAGVIIVKTAIGVDNNDLINSPKNLWRTATKKKITKK
ncbi:MAG: TonB-dependent receptor plug domain-containing protein [Candidatus Marisimplicoccus sp.]